MEQGSRVPHHLRRASGGGYQAGPAPYGRTVITVPLYRVKSGCPHGEDVQGMVTSARPGCPPSTTGLVPRQYHYPRVRDQEWPGLLHGWVPSPSQFSGGCCPIGPGLSSRWVRYSGCSSEVQWDTSPGEPLEELEVGVGHGGAGRMSHRCLSAGSSSTSAGGRAA